MEDSKNSATAPDSEAPADFHSESIRKSGVLLTVVSLLSSAFAWILFDDAICRWAIAIVGCFLLYLGLRLMLARKMFRTWFDKGRVYWEFPSSLQGVDGSCAIADVARLHCNKAGGNNSDPSMLLYHLIQKDGSQKFIGWRCMGDAGKFLARLREENPNIAYTEGER